MAAKKTAKTKSRSKPGAKGTRRAILKSKKAAKMKGKPGVKVKRFVGLIPQTIEHASELLGELGEKQREAKAVADETDAEVTRIKEASEAKLLRLQHEIAKIFIMLRSFANVRRHELTDGGKKKTIELATGVLSWRMTPFKVGIEDEEAVLAKIEELGLDQFLRHPPAVIDRDALKKDLTAAGNIPGITITQVEEFRVKPESGTGELNASTVNKLLKAAV
jgi:phage host-nuclease inhibitor protein Gam